jgi:hypothetical protein
VIVVVDTARKKKGVEGVVSSTAGTRRRRSWVGVVRGKGICLGGVQPCIERKEEGGTVSTIQGWSKGMENENENRNPKMRGRAHIGIE